jgi:alanyl-tRNA synthetase
VALNYPNSQEGKTAETLINTTLPQLQKLKFDGEKATSWKLVYKVTDTISATNKILINKIKKFTTERTSEKLSSSIDTYYMNDVLLVVHGIPSEGKANDIATILQEYKDYNIKEPVMVISSENYKVAQIQKSLDKYVPKASKEEPAKPNTQPVPPTKVP